MQLEELALDFERRTMVGLEDRALAAMEHLLGAIQQAYYARMSGSRGAAGSVGALNTKVSLAQNFIVGTIGFGKAGDYLKFVEYGVQPAAGAKYPAMTKEPGKRMIEGIEAWIIRSRIRIPQKFQPAQLRRANALSRSKTLSRRAGRHSGAVKSRFERAASGLRTHAESIRVKKTHDDPAKVAALRFAWAIAMKRKRFGKAGLRVVEKTAKQQASEILRILEGA